MTSHPVNLFVSPAVYARLKTKPSLAPVVHALQQTLDAELAQGRLTKSGAARVLFERPGQLAAGPDFCDVMELVAECARQLSAAQRKGRLSVDHDAQRVISKLCDIPTGLSVEPPTVKATPFFGQIDLPMRPGQVAVAASAEVEVTDRPGATGEAVQLISEVASRHGLSFEISGLDSKFMRIDLFGPLRLAARARAEIEQRSADLASQSPRRQA